MSKRRGAVEETKRRIVEATMELHNSQGVLATSWEQIAERADVSPATVYRHFPSFDELLPACGALSFSKLALPTEDQFRERLGEPADERGRLAGLVAEVFAIYERGGDTFWAMRRDRASLPILQQAHEQTEDRLAAFTEIALGPLGLDEELRRTVRALIDFHAWSAMREHGLRGQAAVEVTVGLLGCRLGLDGG